LKRCPRGKIDVRGDCRDVSEVIPDDVRELARLTRGHVVGGAVRDIMMGLEPKDFDMTSPYTPDELIELLEGAGHKVIPKGVEFGTVSTILEGVGEVEITTHRTEQYSYEGGRKPEVAFGTSLEEDLERRDFSINAMAIDPITGEVTDIFGGVKDIEGERLKFVGNADERIREDPLRMVRACRFASRMDFELDERDREVIRRNRDQLGRVSVERVLMEFEKASGNMSGFVDCMADTGLLDEVFGEDVVEDMKTTLHDERGSHYGESVFQLSLDVLQCLDERPGADLPVKLAGLYHDMGKPETISQEGDKVHFLGHEKRSMEICKASAKRLKMSKALEREACFIVQEHMRLPRRESNRSIARIAVDYRLQNVPAEWIDDVFDFIECDAPGEDYTELRRKVRVAYDTDRPSAERFMHIEPRKRGEAVRGLWIQHAIENLEEAR